jgi:hypothetical protein
MAHRFRIRVLFHGEWGWVVVVATGALSPCVAVLLAGYTLSWRDTSSLFEPMRPLIAEALRRFQLPLWNPYEGAGLPLFAQLLHGVLHPWSIVAAVLAPRSGTDLMIVLHVLTGAVGAGVLARSLGASRAGAAVAGLGYGLSGYLLGLSAVIQYLAAGGTAPWAIAALRLAGQGGPTSVVIGAGVFAILVFAGDPQWAIVAAALSTMLATERYGARGGSRVAVAAGIGGLLAAVQLLPSWAMLAETSRSGGLTAADAAQWAFHPARVLELVTPGFFGGRPGPTPAPVFLWLDGPSQYPLPFLQSVFIGLPVLLCAVWGIRASRAGRWIGIAAGVLLWLALGHWLFATQVLSWVPVWGSFRYTEKLVGPFTLLLALLAGLGLSSCAAHGLDRLRRPAWLSAPLLLALSALAFGAGGTMPGPESWPAEIWPLVTTRLGGSFALAGVTLALLAVVAARHSGSGDHVAARERWIVALVFATGLLASPAALHAGRRDALAPEPLAHLRTSTAVPRVIQPVDQIALPIARGFDMFDAAQIVRSAAGRPSYNVPARIDSFVTYTGLLPRRYNNLLERFGALGPARWTGFRRFAVTHVVITPPLTNTDLAEAEAAIAGGNEVWRDRDGALRVFVVPHTPWARFATEVRQATNEDDAIRLTVASATRNSAVVVLEGTPPSSFAAGSVLAVERGADHVRIVAEAPSEGLLVVGDSWWPGWTARVDGMPVPILRADAIVRAVVWPAGRHVLDMAYRPREIAIGAAVSVTTVILLIGMVLAGRRRSATSRGR